MDSLGGMERKNRSARLPIDRIQIKISFYICYVIGIAKAMTWQLLHGTSVIPVFQPNVPHRLALFFNLMMSLRMERFETCYGMKFQSQWQFDFMEQTIEEAFFHIRFFIFSFFGVICHRPRKESKVLIYNKL